MRSQEILQKRSFFDLELKSSGGAAKKTGTVKGEAKASKIKRLETELKELGQQVSTLSKTNKNIDTIRDRLNKAIAAFKKSEGGYIAKELSKLDTADLHRLSLSFNTNDKTHQTNTLFRAIFKKEYEMVDERINEYKTVLMSLETTFALMVTEEWNNDAGFLNAKQLQTRINDIMVAKLQANESGDGLADAFGAMQV